MNHLTEEQIMEFVSIDVLNNESIKLMKTVNEHIRTCPECLKKVQAFQLMHDEFDTLCQKIDMQNESEREITRKI